MTNAINTQVRAALDHAHGYAKAVDAIRAALKGQLSPEAVQQALMQPVATYYGVKLVAKQRGEGVTWDKDSAKWETAKKSHQRLCASVLGEGKAQRPELDVPADIAAVAAKLVKMCGEYEDAARLIATAIAQAKAAK